MGKKQRTGGQRPRNGPFNVWPFNNLPGGERATCQFPNNTNYCGTCGCDLDPRHTSKTCIYKHKNPKHNDAATISNMTGGSTRNTFHHKKQRCWR